MGHDTDLADLAQLILNVGRLVRARTPDGPGVVPMTDTERHVMRVVDLFPGASPSRIADRAGLQRTNVSTALRALEEKGMISRRATAGRGVAVHPTERAAANLRTLRAVWARELAEALGEDLDDVRRCTALLDRIERHFTTGHSTPGRFTAER